MNTTVPQASYIKKGKINAILLIIISLLNSLLEFLGYDKSWFYSFLITATLFTTCNLLLSIKSFLNKELSLNKLNKYIYILIVTTIIGGVLVKLFIKYEDALEVAPIQAGYILLGVLSVIILLIIEAICYFKLGTTLSKTTNKTALSFSTFAYTTLILNIVFIVFAILEFNLIIAGVITAITPLIYLLNGFRIASKQTNDTTIIGKVPKSNNKILIPLTVSLAVFLIVYTNKSELINSQEDYLIPSELNTTDSDYQPNIYNSKVNYNNDSNTATDNRSNQLNPNNDSYYQSRGYESTVNYNNQIKASRDNRANQLNPNNNSYQTSRSSSTAASNNRSNQMNPNNAAYKGGKK